MTEPHPEPQTPLNGHSSPLQGDLAAQIAVVMMERGLTQAAVAKEAGISSSTLSQFLSGQYGGNQESISQKLRTWFGNLRRRDTVQAFSLSEAFIETPTAMAILSCLELAQIDGDIAVIAGAPGVGKTTSLLHFRAAQPRVVWCMKMAPVISSIGALLETLGQELGVPLATSYARMSRDIVQKLAGTHGLLIIDEAHFLSSGLLEMLRHIHDASGIGLALCGDLRLHEKVNALSQVSSRVGRWLAVPNATRADVGAFCKAHNVTDREGRTFLADLATGHRALRGLEKLIRDAVRAANGSPVTLDHLAQAHKSQRIGGAV